MINPIIDKLIDNLPDTLKNTDKPTQIDLILGGGAFNGSYLIGALFFLKEMEKRSLQKSTLLYNTIDSLPLFTTYVAKEDRSRMNAVFFIEDESLQNKFLDKCKENGMVGVKGYRTVGGIRVSMYNALALESVEAICNLMKEFAAKNG